jgi:hypothetical protein
MNDGVLCEDRADGLAQRPVRAAWWWRVVGPLALPLVLWWIGSFFLQGDLGLWVDDYTAHWRDPVTGTYETRRLFEVAPGPFWRPIHMVVTLDLITLAWNDHWLMHGVCAAMHLLNVVLLFRVLGRLGMRRTVASVCGILFLTAPMGFEAIFWPSTVSTGISLAIFQGMLLLFVRVVSRAEWGFRGWALVSLLGPIMFAIGCWYEQVLTMISCLPFIYIAVAPRLARVWSHVGRMVYSIGMGMGGGILCAILVMTAVGANRRGSTESFATTDQLWDKTVLIARQVWARMTMDAFLPGAVRTGWTTMGQQWEVGILALVLLMVSGAAWLAWRWRLIGEEQWAEETGGERGVACRGVDSGLLEDWWRLGLIMMGGLVVFLFAWLPVVLILQQRTESRLCYVPLWGLMLMLGPVLELLARCLRPWRRMQRGVLMGVGVGAVQASVVGAIALVGVQSSFQRRYRMDQEQVAWLQRLVPDPAPRTAFMPMRVEDWPTATGSIRFDAFAISVWDAVWSADSALKHAYRRKEVGAIGTNRWSALPIAEVNDESFVLVGPGKRVVAWSTVVPFTVDRSGQLRLVEEVVFKRKGVELERVELPLAKRARERSPALGHLFVRGFVVELGS